MRLHYIILLAVAALASSIDPSLATSSPETGTASSPAVARLISAEHVTTDAKRLLRIETAAAKDEYDEGEEEEQEEEEEEERAYLLPVSATEKLSTLAKTSVKSTKFDTTTLANNYFKRLNLDKANGYLFNSENLKDWARHVVQLNRNDPDAAMGAMLTTLTTYYKPELVARWIQSAKASANVGTFATNLQNALFTKWFNAGYDAIGVRKMLRVASTGTALDAKRDEAIVQAFHNFAREQKLA